ncbi:MAG: hypothetical protein SOW78_12295 [Clostridia bacterium]|nr:hypothetical protein [Clostridia bacterium]
MLAQSSSSDEISKLLQEKNADELTFITEILREICSNIKGGRITIEN